jgi:hypothetical protein
VEGDGADLACQCSIQLVAFIHHLATFINTVYLEMSNAAGFTNSKEVWELVTSVVVKISSDLRDAMAVAQELRCAAGFIVKKEI